MTGFLAVVVFTAKKKESSASQIPFRGRYTSSFRSFRSEVGSAEVAGRARPQDHLRSPSICSAIKRDNGTNPVEHTGDVEVGGFLGSLKCSEHGFEINGFDLCTRQSFGDAAQLPQIIVVGVTAMFGNDDTPDGFPFGVIRQVHIEQLVEAAFAQHLGWELGDVVGGGDDEPRFGFLLHPTEEGAEDTGTGSTVGLAGGLGTGEALLQFVNPQAARCDDFRGLDDGSEVGFRLPDQTAVELAGVEFEEGDVEDGGGGFGGEAFASAREAEDEEAYRPKVPSGRLIMTEAAR